MGKVVATLVKEITTSGFAGTGPIQLAGAPGGEPWARKFIDAVGNANTCEIVVRGSNGEWERSIVTVNSSTPDTLTRGTVIENHLGTTALINFTAGVKDVVLVGPKYLDPTVPRGYIDGLILSNNGIDTAHDIDISPGVVRDDGDKFLWNSVANDGSVTTSATAALRTLSVPLGIKVEPLINLSPNREAKRFIIQEKL